MGLPTKKYCLPTKKMVGNLVIFSSVWRGKKPNLKHFQEFGSTCFVLNDKEHGSKFDLKSYKGIVLGYLLNTIVSRVFNKRSKTVMESTNVVVDDQGTTSIDLRLDDSDTKGP